MNYHLQIKFLRRKVFLRNLFKVHFVKSSYLIVTIDQGRIEKFFVEEEFEMFLYGREHLGFGIFFLKNPSKLKKNPKGAGGLTPKHL